MNDPTPQPPRPQGKTFWDILDRWLSTRNRVAVLALAVIGISALLWLLAHVVAEPGAEVSLAGGIVKYVKARPTSPTSAPVTDGLHVLEGQNSLLTSQLRSETAVTVALRQQLADLSKSPSTVQGDALPNKRITELEAEREQLRQSLKKTAACTKERESTESVRQLLSACETRALRAENPPSVFVLNLMTFTSIPDCKDKFSSAFGKLTSGRPIQNHDSAVGITVGRYFIYAVCSTPASSFVLAAGPEYLESERLARLVDSYLTSR